MSHLTEATEAQPAWDPERARERFPAFESEPLRGLAYLDSAATGQRLGSALAAQERFYLTQNANARRGAHALAALATEAQESARARVAAFCKAKPEETLFAPSATMAINALARALGVAAGLGPGKTVVCSELEHHSNFLPWMEIARQSGAAFEVLPVDELGRLSEAAGAERLSRPDVAILAISALSNVTGCAPPTRALIAAAKSAGALTLVDAAQAIAHGEPWPEDRWGADCAVFSGHKAYAPFGVGVWLASEELQARLEPSLWGGGMVSDVALKDGVWRARWSRGPAKFEPGTQDSAAQSALGAALEEMRGWDAQALRQHEAELARWSAAELGRIPGVRILGDAQALEGMVSFHADWAHAHDIGTALDARGVLIRVGHHCAMPLMRRWGVSACSRASFGPYSTQQEARRLVEAVEFARRRLA